MGASGLARSRPSDNAVKLPSSPNPLTTLSRQVDKAADGLGLRKRGEATGPAATATPAPVLKTRTSSLPGLTRQPLTAEALSRHDAAARPDAAPRAGTSKLAEMMLAARRGSTSSLASGASAQTQAKPETTRADSMQSAVSSESTDSASTGWSAASSRSSATSASGQSSSSGSSAWSSISRKLGKHGTPAPVTSQPAPHPGPETPAEPTAPPKLVRAARIDSHASTASTASTWSSLKGKVSKTLSPGHGPSTSAQAMRRFGRSASVASDTSVSSVDSNATDASSASSETSVSTQSSASSSSSWSSIKAKASKPFAARPKPAAQGPELGRVSTNASTSSKASTASSSSTASEAPKAKDSRSADMAFKTAVWGTGMVAKGALRAAKRHLPEPMVFPEGEHPLMPGTLPEMQDDMQELLKPEPAPVKSRNPLVRARKWVEEAPDKLQEKAENATADFMFNQAYNATVNTLSEAASAAYGMLPSMEGPEFENGHHELMPGTLPEHEQELQDLLSKPEPTLADKLQKSIKQAAQKAAQPVQKAIIKPATAAIDEKAGAFTSLVGLKGAELVAQGAVQALNRQLAASRDERQEDGPRLMPGTLPEMKDGMKDLLDPRPASEEAATAAAKLERDRPLMPGTPPDMEDAVHEMLGSHPAPETSKAAAAPTALPEAAPAEEAPAPELPDRSSEMPGAWVD